MTAARTDPRVVPLAHLSANRVSDEEGTLGAAIQLHDSPRQKDELPVARQQGGMEGGHHELADRNYPHEALPSILNGNDVQSVGTSLKEVKQSPMSVGHS